MATNAELKAKRLARQKKKKEATGGKSLGTESLTVIRGKKGKADTWTSRRQLGKDNIDYEVKGKLKKGTNVKKLMKAEGEHQMKKRKTILPKHSRKAEASGVKPLRPEFEWKAGKLMKGAKGKSDWFKYNMKKK